MLSSDEGLSFPVVAGWAIRPGPGKVVGAVTLTFAGLPPFSLARGTLLIVEQALAAWPKG
jgi:hypothetical protein